MNSKRTWQVLRFQPIYQERVWGGRRLETLYGRLLPRADTPYGESWEICDREEAQSVVQGGDWAGWTLHQLWQEARWDVFGESLAKHQSQRFPLLLKILDAEEDLSIQVHPNDGNAAQVQGEAKSEAWYVAHAEPGAKLYAGLKAGVTRQSFQSAMADGSLATQVQELPAEQGGCVAIAGGVVHAIGAGLVIYEIQQNSDTTYRVFDWNRVGLDGKLRELHQEAALRVTDFDAPPVQWQSTLGERLLDWPYFQLHEWTLQAEEKRQAPSGFVIGAVVSGEFSISQQVFQPGDFFMIPAVLEESARELHGGSKGSKVLWIS